MQPETEPEELTQIVPSSQEHCGRSSPATAANLVRLYPAIPPAQTSQISDQQITAAHLPPLCPAISPVQTTQAAAHLPPYASIPPGPPGCFCKTAGRVQRCAAGRDIAFAPRFGKSGTISSVLHPGKDVTGKWGVGVAKFFLMCVLFVFAFLLGLPGISSHRLEEMFDCCCSEVGPTSDAAFQFWVPGEVVPNRFLVLAQPIPMCPFLLNLDRPMYLKFLPLLSIGRFVVFVPFLSWRVLCLDLEQFLEAWGLSGSNSKSENLKYQHRALVHCSGRN